MTLTPEEIEALGRQLADAIAQGDQARQQEWDDEQEEAEYRFVSDRIQVAQAELRQLQQDADAQRALIEAHPWLDQVRAFVDGEITHLAVRDRVQVGTVDEVLKATSESDARKVRLVTITPKAGPAWASGAKWEINTYSDGSGGDGQIVPCRSLEAAHDQVREWFLLEVAKFRHWDANGRTGRDLAEPYAWKQFLESGVELEWPADVVEAVEENLEESRQTEVRKAEEVLDARRQRLFEPSPFPEPVPAGQVQTPRYVKAERL